VRAIGISLTIPTKVRTLAFVLGEKKEKREERKEKGRKSNEYILTLDFAF